MSTRANPMAGRYFNDPGIAAAVSNLAGAFAPPSAEEYLLAEKVKGKRTTNAALADLYGLAGGDFDKLGIVANLYDPSNSYYSVDTQAATARRGQDVTANTTIATNDAYNERALKEAILSGVMDPMGRQSVDQQMLDAILPGAGIPGITAAQPVAPTETQAMGAIIAQGAQDLTPEDIYALTMGDVPTQQIVTDSGNRLTFGALAARDGAQPYNPTGGQAAPDPVMLIDPDTGERISGFATPQGTYVLGDGKTPAPANLVAYKLPQVQGTAEEVGGIGRTTLTENDRRFIASAKGIETVNDAIANFTANPGTQGALGFTRRMFQGAVQTLREAGAVAGDTDLSSVTSLLEQGLIDEAVAARIDPAYNPALTEAQILGNMVVWAYASAQQGDGRVSNQQLDEAMAALGLNGVFATTADAITAATRVKQMLERDFNSTASLASPDLVRAYSPEVRNGTGAPAATTRLRFDAEGNPVP